ncbi:protein of unknown function [Tenacibaculum sp. 190130A14a]|uniref:Uncharacterized protein n=1 Tax=Tenacibaculum polynesiense TaxID=3137857 RepID=A0ABM9P9H1_9FLAO
MKKYLIILTFFFTSYSFSQNNDLYEKDSAYHKSLLNKYIDGTDKDEVFYLTFYGFDKNETYFFKLKNKRIEVFRLENKKFSTKSKCKKLKLSDIDKNNIEEALKMVKSKSLELDKSRCFGYDTVHYYDIEVNIFNKRHIVSSKCLRALIDNKYLSSLFNVIDF